MYIHASILTMSFDVLDVNSLLQVLTFMNARCLARVSCGSRLGAVAAHEAQQQPHVLVVKGQCKEVSASLGEKLAARPTVAFLQYHTALSHEAIERFVMNQLPRETVVLGAATNSLQCAYARSSSAKQTVLTISDEPTDIGVLLATFPEASAHAFCIRPEKMSFGEGMSDNSESDSDYSEDCDEDPTEDEMPDAELLPSVLESVRPEPEGEEVPTANQDCINPWLASLPGQDTAAQSDWVASLPAAIETPSQEVLDLGNRAADEATESAEAAEAAEGEVEVAAAAEFAEEVKLAEDANSECASSQNGWDELLSLNPPPKVVVVHAASNAKYVVAELQSKFPEAAIIGGYVMGQETFSKYKSNCRFSDGVGVLAITGNAPLFAMTSPFEGSSKKAMADVRAKMRRAQELATLKEQRILGALLITCNGRGRRMFGREGCDASLFQSQFPEAPLLGYYAGGEIGPGVEDSADIANSSFEAGNAAIRGFTAVYGFFLMPRKHAPSVNFQRAVLNGEVQEAFQALQK